MKRLKQIFGLRRYFIIVYMYSLDNGITGQGQVSMTSAYGNYVNVSDLVEALNGSEDLGWDGDVEEFVLLNVMELNKRDFRYYTEHSKFKENEKL